MTLKHTVRAMAPPMITMMIIKCRRQQGKMNKVGKAMTLQVKHIPSHVHDYACHACCAIPSRVVTTNDHQNPSPLTLEVVG